MDLVTIRGPEEPWVVFAQPELPLSGIKALNAIESVELWLARNEGSGDDLNVLTAQLYLADAQTRLSRARRWHLVRDINQRCMHSWGVLLHGGTESAWLVDDAAHALVDGLWLASLLCSHSACERHLAGILSLDEQSRSSTDSPTTPPSSKPAPPATASPTPEQVEPTQAATVGPSRVDILTLNQSWTRWGLGRLIEEAEKRDFLPPDLRERLSVMNEARKASAHFKPPLYDGSLVNRVVARDLEPAMKSLEELAEADAFAAYETARSLIHRVGS